MTRRHAFKFLSVLGGGFLGARDILSQTQEDEELERLKIEDLEVIATSAGGAGEWIIVKLMTSRPGLYGLGSATNVLYTFAILEALRKHIKPFLIGKEVAKIQDLWHQLNFRGYWRSGTIHNNILAAIDVALWDIKGKLAAMSLNDLFGGKVREAVPVYVHADGNSDQEVYNSVEKFWAEGFRYIRVQLGGYTGAGLVSKDSGLFPLGSKQKSAFDDDVYIARITRLLETIRNNFGPEIKILHDAHGHLSPPSAVKLAKTLEPLNLYFLEDPLAPEHVSWLRNIKSICSTPIAMSEVFTNPYEWRPLVSKNLIDFLRCRISQNGGITSAKKIANYCEFHGVKTAWQQGGDVDPVHLAATYHIDLTTSNFGISEKHNFIPEPAYEIMPGMPVVKAGYIYGNDRPGLGIDINEKLARKYPIEPKNPNFWTPPLRRPDGSLIPP